MHYSLFRNCELETQHIEEAYKGLLSFSSFFFVVAHAAFACQR